MLPSPHHIITFNFVVLLRNLLFIPFLGGINGLTDGLCIVY